MAATAFITVEEALAYSDPGRDPPSAEQVAVYQPMVDAVCEAMEEYCHRPIVARSLTKVSDGGVTRIFLAHQNPGHLSVTSVIEDGTALVSGTDYLLYEAEGYVARVSGGAFATFTDKPQAVRVVYTAGVAQTVEAVPAVLKLAAKVAFKFYRRQGDEDMGVRMEAGQFIRPDKFPQQCLWIMDKYRLRNGGAT